MPPLTRSSTRKSLGKPKTPKKKKKMHNKKLGSKPVQGKMPLYSSNTLELKNRSTGRRVKSYLARTFISTTKDEERRILSIKQIGESALSDYNKQHGTDLEYLRPLDDEDIHGPGYTIDFDHRHAYWKHFNFEARRRRKADPSGKPLLLFAEVYCCEEKFVLTSLLQVEPTDGANGCQECCSNISHPRHGFRADFHTERVEESKILSEEVAAELSETALQDYNEKQGTNLKFVRALSCNSFESTGVLMDFTKKKTSWVHMNFEAKRVGCK